MKLESSFSVPAENTRVFELLLDPETMRSCIPGCEELVRVDETHYTGRLVNEIAHVRFNASFSAEIVGMEAPHELRAVLKGEDRRLASSLKLDAGLQVRADGPASLVSYSMEMAMWGKLGRMGESIFRRRTAEVERQFVDAFTLACEAEPPREGPPVAVRHRAATTSTAPPASRRPPSWWRRVLGWFTPSSRGGRR